MTNKPILLSETAVGADDDPFVNIPNLFSGMVQYKTLGLVWFDKDQNNGILHQDWRLEGDPAAAFAFRLGVEDTLTPGSKT